jgi:hypothetical protein
MTTEKPLQDFYCDVLKANGVPFLHLPNTAHRKVRAKYDSFNESCLKHFPDIDFQYNGVRYLRELGVPGRHLGRKSKQLEKMRLYGIHGANIAIITSLEAAEKDLKEIGLIK